MQRVKRKRYHGPPGLPCGITVSADNSGHGKSRNSREETEPGFATACKSYILHPGAGLHAGEGFRLSRGCPLDEHVCLPRGKRPRVSRRTNIVYNLLGLRIKCDAIFLARTGMQSRGGRFPDPDGDDKSGAFRKSTELRSGSRCSRSGLMIVRLRRGLGSCSLLLW
jgi:hypothetical protein